MDVVSGLHMMKLVKLVKRMKKNEFKHKLEIRNLKKRMADQSVVLKILLEAVTSMHNHLGFPFPQSCKEAQTFIVQIISYHFKLIDLILILKPTHF